MRYLSAIFSTPTLTHTQIAATGEHGRTMSGEIAAAKQRGRPFQPGQSGNPKGKPKGARNRAPLAAEVLLDGEAEALTRKAIELALAGDTVALRIVWNGCCRPGKIGRLRLNCRMLRVADPH